MTARYHAVIALIESGIDKLPIATDQIENIISSKGFSIINYDVNYSKHIEILKTMNIFALAKRVKAFTYTSKDERIVFISSGLSNNDKRLLLAHELGHIALGHMSDNCVVGCRPGGLIDEGQEDEANSFALEFLAPVCVLDRKHILSAETISSVTLLDNKRSRLVADEIKNHKKFTDYELKLCNQFEFKNLPRKSVKMKLIISALCFVVSISGVTSINHFLASNTHQTRQRLIYDYTQDVFVTKFGDKYHDKDCRHIANKENILHMTIEEALAAGYEPCEDCKPTN